MLSFLHLIYQIPAARTRDTTHKDESRNDIALTDNNN